MPDFNLLLILVGYAVFEMAKAAKVLGWVITAILVLFICAMGFIHFVPGYSFSLVRSGSMAPAINVGDVIITGPAHEGINRNIEAGTVIMYQHNTETISHRVLSVEGITLVTKGDAMQHPDPWTVTLTDVKGVYLFRIPFIGYGMNFIQSKLGWFLTIIIPAAAIVGFLIKDIVKEAFKDEKKTANIGEVKPVMEQNDKQKSAK